MPWDYKEFATKMYAKFDRGYIKTETIRIWAVRNCSSKSFNELLDAAISNCTEDEGFREIDL